MATFVGTDNADTLNATADGDVLLGNGGNDTLNGVAGAQVLNGGAGSDSMTGGDGNDFYYVDAAGDVVREAANGGTDTIASSVNYTLAPGSAVEALYFNNTFTAATATAGTAGVSTATTGVSFSGNEFAQSIYGTAGADFLAGGRNSTGLGGDSLYGGAGDDTYLVSNAGTVIGNEDNAANGSDTVYVSISDLEAGGQAVATYSLLATNPNAQIETISAQSQRDTQNFSLTGNQFDQKVIGNFGANTLNGGGGADTLIGLDGNDTYQITSGTETIQETSGFDTLTFNSATLTTYNLATSAAGANANVSIERLVLNDVTTNVTGNNQGQILDASGVAAGNATTLNGGAGNDTLIGHAGNDTFVVDQDGETVTETTGATGFGGTDTVIFNGTTGGFNLADGQSIEVIAAGDSTTGARLASNGSQTTGAAAGVYLVGNDASQAIFGAGGADILNGDRGTSTNADTLAGGAGNDIYRVYAQTDVVTELQFDATGAFTATNAGGTDTIFTSATYSLATNAAVTLGGVANTASVIETLSAADQSATTAINLTGYVNAERLIGNAGNNTLDGGLNTTVAANGARVGDTLQGLAGNDTYIIHSANDVVIEAAGGGTDTLTFAADYTGVTGATNAYVLAAGAEIDTINLTTAVNNVTGNAFAQVINGTAGADTITGGGGADLLVGGAGADVYNIADSAAVVQDTDGGTNTVNYTGTTGGFNVNNGSSITAINATGTFAAGSTGVFLVGNNLVQTITGGAGSDILNGNGGVDANGRGDSLVGGDGNDTYRVYTSNLAGNGTASTAVGDQITEGANGGNDTVYTSANYVLQANVENLVAADQANVTTLTLVGNELNNAISGSNGNNVLVGAGGNDTLTGLGGADTFHFNQAVGTANADVIADFSASQGDRISLDAGIFTGLGTAVDAAEFQMGTVATGAQATILFDQATGRLFYDADGAGAGTAELFATVSAGTTLSAANFVITPAGTLPTA